MLKRLWIGAPGLVLWATVVATFCLGGLDLVAGETRVFKHPLYPLPRDWIAPRSVIVFAACINA
ncbi:hypothetical protein [Rhodoligotrophos defluvii]|uniref:hypothetical protein n=1 Tax=Rhodoligotrophos defluvii TaxID=2561934 RepID=UPI0010CA1AAB|nr:hypothetical protein [Rhodoligotrophos defluvii]